MSDRGWMMALLIVFGAGAVAIPWALTFLLWHVMGANGYLVAALAGAASIAWALACLGVGSSMEGV